MRYTVVVDFEIIAWYKEGTNLRHREDGPAVEYTNGTKLWYINGSYHRDDGPAKVFRGGDKHWFRHGLPHRDDGPAIEYANGDQEWFLDGKKFSEEQFNMLKSSCHGKVVEIEGKKYKLVLQEDKK